jgi:dTMP kinase
MDTMEKNTKTVPGGLVIMFEGIDGVGKTTQLELVQEALEADGWPVFPTRNMGGTPIGEAFRTVLLSDLERPPLTDFYASLAIQEPLIAVINQARKQGKIVLMDRGPLSLAAYQIYGGGIDASLGWRHVESGMDRIKPDRVILYDIDPNTALARVRNPSKQSDYFESKPLDYFQDVADGFKAAAERYGGVVSIDAAQPIAQVHERTMAVVNELLNSRAQTP